ncbi:response regulator [Shimia sp. R10_1]|uniref:response regulator n=1 Tax=Shimia sp. R10_1 TaxID=2821095 RepID=UPI001ADAD7DC|nr:response regulator [Shimia sp. R10_1]MBO9475821.1 response regulator [Shimia sp. R10_1]
MARVLIVEDDQSVLELLSRSVSWLGHEIETATDSENAMNLLQRLESVDIVIADFWLNGISVISFLDQVIKEMPSAGIIVISGGAKDTSFEMTKALVQSCGPIEFLQKPFRKFEIWDAINRVARDQCNHCVPI